MRRTPSLALLAVLALTAQSQSTVHVSSPDNNITFDIRIENHHILYDVSYHKQAVIVSSPLTISFADGIFRARNTFAEKAKVRDGVEGYVLITGKTSKVSDPYREATIPLISESTPTRLNLVVRIFNDGLAFRYEFIQVTGTTHLTLTDEKTTFHFAGNPIVTRLPLPDFTGSHEGFYERGPLDELANGQLLDMPALFELPGPVFVAITEAALLDYAGMYLTNESDTLRGILSPLPGQTTIKVRASLPHKSPWRVLMISNRVGALIESNILTDLAPPCRVSDTSWIKPGKTTFPWWNGNVTPDTLNAPGMNFVTAQYYIDFCARNDIAYHSVVEYGLHQWYTDDGTNFQPGPHPDVTQPVPGLDMKAICDYATSVGVGVRVWVHWAALYPKLDAAFALFEAWGLRGMMVDFMDRDDQEMVNIQTEILEKAASHHLHIQFHGAYKPTGLSRTYPNEFSREGTLNYEVNKWDREGLPPDHDIMIPFTRMLAGSTDYHLGGFRAVPRDQYICQYTRPLMLGTRCHMLAMYVVLQNALGMVCDYPAAYEGEPGFDFIRKVPTTWDETRVIAASVGEFIVIARRKGNDWFLGGITNHEGRELHLGLDFLSPGKAYTMTTYTDPVDALDYPNHLMVKTKIVTSTDSHDVALSAAGGGMAAIITTR